jgi:hypothetical protein
MACQDWMPQRLLNHTNSSYVNRKINSTLRRFYAGERPFWHKKEPRKAALGYRIGSTINARLGVMTKTVL